MRQWLPGKHRDRSNVKRNVLRIVFFVLTACAFIVYALWAPHRFDAPKTVVIGKGKSFAAAAEILQDSGVVGNSLLFRAVGKMCGAQSVRAGRYVFRSGMSSVDLIRDMQEGRSAVSFYVTIPEGFRGAQIAGRLQKEVGIDSAKFMEIFADGNTFGLKGKVRSLEGYLFPDTYDFAYQENEYTIIERMVHRFEKFFVDSLLHRAQMLKLSVNDIITMASIVEGEAIKDEERPVIAGLYYNRLKIRMRLEADPTVQYAIADGPRRLTYTDLQTRSPYNTYRMQGLPPGPINNPGSASIMAALFPAKHRYLFFVADGAGGHRFARTYDGHKKNVRTYRKHRSQ